jgi:hypothetical protein
MGYQFGLLAGFGVNLAGFSRIRAFVFGPAMEHFSVAEPTKAPVGFRGSRWDIGNGSTWGPGVHNCVQN